MRVSNLALLAALAVALFGAEPASAGQENWFIFGKRSVETDRAPAPRVNRRNVRAPSYRERQVRSRQALPARQSTSVRKPRRLATTPTTSSVYQPARQYQRQTVAYYGDQAPGTVVIDTRERFLYHVHADGTATRYGVGVGRAGFEWRGTATIERKAEWPDWRPPKEMIAREKAKGRTLPEMMPGGPNNPLGARALYLYQGKRDTLYRIHGTNNPRSIGLAMSSGCIRMMNDDVTHLYNSVSMGTKVVVM